MMHNSRTIMPFESFDSTCDSDSGRSSSRTLDSIDNVVVDHVLYRKMLHFYSAVNLTLTSSLHSSSSLRHYRKYLLGGDDVKGSLRG
jgi:hypothetical protein